MENLKLKFIGAIALILFAAIYYYITLPAINIHASGFWFFIMLLWLSFRSALIAKFIAIGKFMPAITAKCGKSALRRRIRGRSRLRRFLRGFRGVDGISFAVTKRFLAGRTIHEPVGKPRTEIQLIVHIFHFRFTLLAGLSIRQTAVPVGSFKNAHIDTSFLFYMVIIAHKRSVCKY